MDMHFDFASEDYDSYLKAIKKSGLGLSCPVIHIAGSNGKSSIANFLAGIYESSGRKVGLFLNHFVSHPRQMIQINHQPIALEEYEKYEKNLSKIADKFDLSALQRIFMIALSYFESAKLDLCVIETGLGGSLDATHIHYPKLALCLISNISLEHTELLGTTLSQIGNEKCGIFQERVPVLFGSLDESCKSTMIDLALSLDCPIHHVDEPHYIQLKEDGFHFDYGGNHDLRLASFAHYDIANACLVLEAVAVLQGAFPVTEESLRKGLTIKPLPGHFQRIDNILFDVAENPAAMSVLMRSLAIFRAKQVDVIFASSRDQNIAVELPLIDNYVHSITLTTYEGKEARVEDDYFLFAPDYLSSPSYEEAKKALLEAEPNALLVVTGNMEFVFECLKKEMK